MKAYVEMDRCLACGGSNLETYLDLGAQPLANSCVETPVDLPSSHWAYGYVPIAGTANCRSPWIPIFCLRNISMSAGQPTR